MLLIRLLVAGTLHMLLIRYLISARQLLFLRGNSFMDNNIIQVNNMQVLMTV